jgi:nucleotide-binding universal stress UspA family protein
MKLILAATDFSKASRNALQYAAELAKKSKAGLVLFHSYMPPVIVSDVPIALPLPEEIEKEALKKLRRTAAGLRLKYGRALKLELVCQYGMAVDAITNYASESKADLIVMGMSGAGALEEKLVGSITTDVIKRSKTPVLSIGQNVKFKPVKNIIFATDYKETASPLTLDALKEIANLYKSHIHILNVLEASTVLPTTKQAVQGLKTEHLFDGYKHSFHAIVNKKVADGIHDFIKLRKIDMTVMVPRKHSVFHTLFKGRATKQVAFHTGVPLLTIHE